MTTTDETAHEAYLTKNIYRFGSAMSKLTRLQQDHLLAVCDAILESDTEETITSIIAWPDPCKPGGAATLLFDEVEGDGEVDIFFATDEAEARRLHALLSAGDTTPLKAINQ